MEELLKIKTAFVEPGMIIGKDIYSSSDYLIAGVGTRLTDRMITRLKFYSIAEITIINPEFLRSKQKTQTPVIRNKPVDNPETSYVGHLKTSPEYREFTKNFYTSLISFRDHINDVVQNKAPLNTENMLADVSKVLASCSEPNALLDMMMCIRNLDDATYVHSMNVGLICNLFAHWIRIPEKDVKTLTLAGLLHDIGKMMIPKEILTKPGKLTDEEFHIIQEHPVLGYNILKQQNVNYHVCMAALMHHERCDGHGYPGKLTAAKIDSYAKIVAIADVYDALTAARCYRGPVCPLEVIGIFQTEGLTQYDPKYLMVFLDRVMCSYLHYTVRLSNGEIGKIVLMNRNSLSRPVIAISDDRFIDLREERNITITEVV